MSFIYEHLVMFGCSDKNHQVKITRNKTNSQQGTKVVWGPNKCVRRKKKKQRKTKKKRRIQSF